MQETVDLVTFTIKIRNGKLHFLCSEFDLLRVDFARNLIILS